MTVIIRLQNLPWSANAADIRQFFRGLAIPEGGVHIVGGAAGDAFIAFSTDEDARQGMASDGGLLKDSRVKLFLSSRAEMQKIIEETRQQHLALQAATIAPASGHSNPAVITDSGVSSAIHRSFGNMMVPSNSESHYNPPSSNMPGASFTNSAASVRPTTIPLQQSDGNSFPFNPSQQVDMNLNHQQQQQYTRHNPPAGFDHPFQRQQPQFQGQQQPFHAQQQHHYQYNANPRMPQHMNPNQNYPHMEPQEQQQPTYGPGAFGVHRMRGPIDSGPMGNGGNGYGTDERNHPLQHGSSAPMSTDRISRDRRDSRGTFDMDRGGGSFRGRDRNRSRDYRGDRESGRRGRRTRSRSRSESPRGGRTGRDRRRRSRSDSRERRRSSREHDRDRDRDRNGKPSSNNNTKSTSLPLPTDQQPENNKSSEIQQGKPTAVTDPEPEANTSIQLRLLSGDLTYRDLREYLNGIHTPNQFIKMINAFDGHRFGLAYIRLLTKADKQKVLMRHNGTIRGYPVQIFHVEDSTFNLAIDSFSPCLAVDAQRLSQSCLALRDFPPIGTAQCVKEAFGSISIGKVLPERNESGTITGLCYVELASETDARKAPQVLKDGVVINNRKVKVAFLPLAELDVCSRNLERLRGVVGGGIPASSAVPSSGTDTPLSPEHTSRHSNMSSVMEIPSFHDNSRAAGTNGLYDQSMMNRGTGARPSGLPQRVFITGLPPSAMERDIGDFFSDVGVIPKLIEIVYDDDRIPVGNAMVQFGSFEEAERAMDKNGGFMGGHTVTVTLVDPPAVVEQLHSSALPPGGNHSPAQGMEGTGHFSSFGQGHGQGGGPRMFHSGHPGAGANGPYNRSHMGGDGIPRYGGPRFPPSGRGGFMGGPRGSRPPMRMRMPMGGPVGMQNGGMNGSNNGDSIGLEDSPTPGFGVPGCVVALTNVPHKALIADILSFFRGYQVTEKCVIRRFGPNGEPTGDARVAFPTPEEAESAIKNLQNEYLLNRRIMLSIV